MSMWAPHAEATPWPELAEQNTAALLRQLSYVHENSAFYRMKWQSAGIDVMTVRTLGDLHEFPFTEKDELRFDQVTNGGLGSYACASLTKTIRVHSSSGTTGRPSFIGVTREDAAIWTDSLSRVFTCMGVTAEDVFLHATGLSFFVGGLPVKDAIEEIGAAFVPIGTGASDRLVQANDALGGTVLFCTPSYARYLADYMQQRLGRDARSLGLRRVLLGAEPGGGVQAIREGIEAAFGCPVREAYGNSDLLPAFAATCDAQGGNHLLTPDLLYLEVIDPDSGEVLPWETGVRGELVGTSLRRWSAPLVRFRTRDHVVVDTQPCECGRSGPRILCVGRTDDMLIVSGVNIWPSAIADVVETFVPRVTGALRVVVNGYGPAVPPPLHIRVERSGDPDDQLGDEIALAIRERLQVKAAIELVPPNSLPRSEMKTSLVYRIFPS